MAWAWGHEGNVTLELPGTTAPLASVAQSLIESSAVALSSSATVSLEDRVGVNVSLVKPLLSSGAEPVTLRAVVTQASVLDATAHDTSSSCADGMTVWRPDVSVDLPLHFVLQAEQLQMIVEEALSLLRDEVPRSVPSLASPCAFDATANPGALLWPQEELVSWSRRGDLLLMQPRVCSQWHPNACGHCAFHNAKLLLRAAVDLANGALKPSASVISDLQDERLCVRQALTNMCFLVDNAPPEGGSSWRPAALRSLILSQSHMRHLIDADPSLAKCFYVVEAEEGTIGEAAAAALKKRFRGVQSQVETSPEEHPNTTVQDDEHVDAIAFVFGAVQHWVSAAVARGPSGPFLLLTDSYNKSLMSDQRNPADIAHEVTEMIFPRFARSLRLEMPQYAEAPDEVIRQVWEQGVPEWWKGKPKSKLYWRHRPADVRAIIMEMEIKAVRQYVDSIEQAVCDVAPREASGEGNK
eukprot:TRINITY_DN34631_c0_g1_i1.p1 TRINITY_DN34631_c0_g1~~TRINITY_DN34631_c0_g1_i1.p1  ORF type:complete len:468 (+),score=71.60 TRINITY_DN34631_c0_g1_i1:38-1441(+)